MFRPRYRAFCFSGKFSIKFKAFFVIRNEYKKRKRNAVCLLDSWNLSLSCWPLLCVKSFFIVWKSLESSLRIWWINSRIGCDFLRSSMNHVIYIVSTRSSFKWKMVNLAFPNYISFLSFSFFKVVLGPNLVSIYRSDDDFCWADLLTTFYHSHLTSKSVCS